MHETDTPAQAGAHERHLAIGAFAQQGSQVVGTLIMLAVVTAIGRTLSLSEFGVYGLLISIATYLLIAQTSVEGAAVKAIAGALDDEARDRAFSVALTLYAAAGAGAGVVLAGGGSALLTVLNIPHELEHQAQLGIFALAAVTAVGWPFRTYQDLLRGSQRFVHAAVAEMFGYLTFGIASIILLASGAPLWILVGVGGSLPVLMGAAARVIVLVTRVTVHFRPALVRRGSLGEFLGLSGYLFAMGIADLVIYSLDRTILGAFKSAATVGLYEGPIRAHNLIRQVNGTLVLTVLPAAARYVEQGDRVRVRELLVRGTRYVVALVVPVTVILMALAEPILHVWLGARFDEAATAMTILMSYWLIASSTAVAAPMLIAAGRARLLAWYAGGVALGNLILSLALTPSLGLEGVTLGTAIPYLIGQPIILIASMRVFDVSARDMARSVWIPAFSLAVPLAAVLVVLRLTLALDTLPVVLGVMAGAFLAYLAGYYAIWLNPGERTLLRSFTRRAAAT